MKINIQYLVIMPGNNVLGNNRKFFDELSHVHPVFYGIPTPNEYYLLVHLFHLYLYGWSTTNHSELDSS